MRLALCITIMIITITLLTTWTSADIAPLKIPSPQPAVKVTKKASAGKRHHRHIRKKTKKAHVTSAQASPVKAAEAVPPIAFSTPVQKQPVKCQEPTIPQLVAKQMNQTISKTKDSYKKYAPEIRSVTKTAWHSLTNEGHRASAVMAKLISGINK